MRTVPTYPSYADRKGYLHPEIDKSKDDKKSMFGAVAASLTVFSAIVVGAYFLLF